MSKLFSENTILVPNSDSPSYDAFGRVRASEPLTLFNDRGYIDNPAFWSSQTTTGGSITTASPNVDSQVKLNVTTTNGSSVTRQTRGRYVYEPAKSLIVTNSISFNAPKTNLRQRVGLFDSNNGIFLQDNGGTYSFVHRSSVTGSPVDTVINQANWNQDTFDGTGPSGINIDFSNDNIFIIDFTWHGAGIIRYGFLIDGAIIYAHIAELFNSSPQPYMSHATLPLRQEITNTGTTGSASTLRWTASSISSEGEKTEQGILAAFSQTTERSLSGTFIPLVSLRINPSFLNTNIELVKTEVINTASGYVQVRILENASLTGATWAITPTASNIAQIDTAATAVSGGREVDSFYLTDNSADALDPGLNQRLLGFSVTGTPDTLTVVAREISGVGEVVTAMKWLERY